MPPSPRGWYYGSIIGVILGSILGSIFGSILGLPFGSILGSILDSIYGSTRPKSKVFRLEILILLIWTNVPTTNVAWTNVVVTVLFILTKAEP